ncbi:MAG: hypothetical protein ABI877_07220, partial [Gemmatimonadaceae bacterium]
MHHFRMVVAAGLLCWAAPFNVVSALPPALATARQQSGGALSGQVSDTRNGPVRGARVSVAELGRAII